MTPRHRLKFIGDTILATAFIAALWMPIIGMMSGKGQFTSGEENRNFVKLPNLNGSDVNTWIAFSEKFKEYFHDHFGFRKTLVSLQANAKVNWLGVSPSSEVVLGDHQWLFYSGTRAMDNYRSIKPFTNQELDAWLRLYKGRRDWLASQGIEYILVIPPEKHTIYPEYLPRRFTRVGRESRLDQLLAYLRAKSDLRVIDVRPALMRSKANGPDLYFHTDTHWNGHGAFVAYREIMTTVSRLFPKLHPVPEEQADLEAIPRIGDLSLMLGAAVPPEMSLMTRPSPEVTTFPDRIAYTISQRRGEDLPRMVMISDSFGRALADLLSRHFSAALYVAGHQLDGDAIRAARPNLVMEVSLERWLISGAPPPDPPFGPPIAGPPTYSEANIARGKPALQSSTAMDQGKAGNAVDGNTNGEFARNSVTHTNMDPNAWWEVDLGVPSTINAIRIWNRTDCCENRLEDYWVFASETPFTSSDTAVTLRKRAGTWNNHQFFWPSPATGIRADGVRARYVRVQLSAPGILSMAEVEVFGREAAP